MYIHYSRRLVVLLGILTTVLVTIGQSATISLDTSPLIGDAAGPFSVAFQLTDGSGFGDSNNTATIANIQFGAGGPSGVATLVGGATGNLGSTVTLTDSSFVTLFVQPFTPGDRLQFNLTTTTNTDVGGAPDQFSFSILDNTGTEIPTQGGLFFDVFIALDLGPSATAKIQSFGTDTARSPTAGGPPISIAPPKVEQIPEPSTAILVAGGMLILGVQVQRRTKG